MGSDKRLRFAVIGAGLIGPRHAQTVMESPDTELVAIVDPLESSATLARDLDTAHYQSVTDLLASPAKPDAAIICTPNHLHVPLAKKLASAGVHVLVEKPVSVDITSGKDLVRHVSATGVRALVGHHRRFNPYMVAAKAVVSSGTLGTIMAVNGLWALRKPDEYFQHPAAWRQTEAGGVVLINMVHEVDLLHFLFGPITSVHAEKTLSQRRFEADEGAALTLRFRSGVVGSFVVADTVASPWNFESGTGENPMIPKAGQDCYRILGTDGSLSVPDMTVWSYGTAPKSWTSELVQETMPVENGTPFERQLEHFVGVIRGQEVPSCTLQAGLGALMVCEAIRRALKDNSTVQVEQFSL
ncbi:quinate utilisation oxidoreductase QutH [Verticillium alfalfae VaMs.102]|uniref:Quinate utilisation oxidoreductase QutH n=1 Tax=Verticillium alfalfae (strain VaMs.102 / ATCC MYA-4576 / FGSC 10136) TaxID=526221 RepID=C9S801_VERA1|nr:quinate utilisation oxidoreductase QutH [Verticillium alfalfae VaMs.102]EEY15291.1 quinate utilisation oxidoreductase QutH [Verticillium alfalfae VaMs.102]